eukprot:7164855-Ditylum_brightwellii.AAC.1
MLNWTHTLFHAPMLLMFSFLFSGGKNGDNKMRPDKAATSPLSPTLPQDTTKTSTESDKSDEQDIQAPSSGENVAGEVKESQGGGKAKIMWQKQRMATVQQKK